MKLEQCRVVRFFISSFVFLILTLVTSFHAIAQEQKPNFIIAKRAYELFDDRLAKQVEKGLANRIAENKNGDETLITLYLGDELYDRLGVGRFEGAPILKWDGTYENDKTPRFIFLPGTFAYVTAAGQRIVPGAMDTDGGSVPRILQTLAKNNAWYYGPAFIIHDWIFAAHKCGHQDGEIGFEESANIMAEAMKTLTEAGFQTNDGVIQKFSKSEDTIWAMHRAVLTSIARDIWDDSHNTKCR